MPRTDGRVGPPFLSGFLVVAVALVAYGLFGFSRFAWYTGEYYDERMVLFDHGFYLRNPQLERNVHRSQNRIESYHQLRSTIAQVGGKKELTGRTDIKIEISNQ